MRLTIGNDSFEVTNVDQLRVHLDHAEKLPHSEIWLHHDSGWPSICALTNGESAWLMFLRYEGDAGYSTRNLHYKGPDNAKMEFYLANGQRDEYPASWDITKAEARRALEFFYVEGTRAPWLHWHDESA